MRLQFILLAAVLVLSGCAARVPQNIKQYAPAVGYTMISGRRLLGGHYVASSIYIPGIRATPKPAKLMECTGLDPEIELFADRAGSDANIMELCSVAREVAASTTKLFPAVSLRYRVYIALPGQRFDFISSSWSRDKPRLSIGIPVFADSDHTRANLADLLAHESFHLAGYLADRQSVSSDELTAYRVGVCAAFMSVGSLDESWFPGAALEGAGEAVIEESSGAANRVRKELERFVEEGKISVETKKGQEFLSSCRRLRDSLAVRLASKKGAGHDQQ